MDSMGEAVQVEKIEADLVYRISWVPSTSIPIPSCIPTRLSTQCPTEQLCYMAAPSSEWMRKQACFENKVKLSRPAPSSTPASSSGLHPLLLRATSWQSQGSWTSSLSPTLPLALTPASPLLSLPLMPMNHGPIIYCTFHGAPFCSSWVLWLILPQLMDNELYPGSQGVFPQTPPVPWPPPEPPP